MHFSDVEYNWYEHDVNLISLYGHLNDGLIGKLDSKYFFTGDTLLSVSTITRFSGENRKRFLGENLLMLKNIEGTETVYPG